MTFILNLNLINFCVLAKLAISLCRLDNTNKHLQNIGET